MANGHHVMLVPGGGRLKLARLGAQNQSDFYLA